MEHLEVGTLLRDSSRCYRIDELVSSWEREATYRARDERAADALVVIREVQAVFDDETRAELGRGAERMASLDHPSIPAVLDHFFAGDRYYLVQELVPGQSIEREVARYGGRVPERVVTKWAIAACEVLRYLHGQDPPIVVGELRPTNVIAGERGSISLVELGLLRAPRPSNQLHGIARMGFVAPETMAGRRDARTDVYSLGAICFYCLTGEDPRDNPLLVFDFTKQPRPRRIEPAITPEMDEIIVRMVEHRPVDRYPSVEALARDLDAHARRLA